MPPPTHETPKRCSISHLNGFCELVTRIFIGKSKWIGLQWEFSEYLQPKSVAPNSNRSDSWQWILDDFCVWVQMVRAVQLYSSIESIRSDRGMLMANPMADPIWMESCECQATEPMDPDLDRPINAFESLCSSLCRTFALDERNERVPHLRQPHESAIQVPVCRLGARAELDPIEIDRENTATMCCQI